MKEERDFSCEIMGLIALTALSALSHFWYILIALCIMAAIYGAALLIALIFLRIGRELPARLLNIKHPENSNAEAAISVADTLGSQTSLPVVQMSTIHE